VISPEGYSYEHALKFTFKTSNNEAEHEALLTGMEICNALGVLYLKNFSNSQLMVSQVKGEFKAHDLSTIPYLAKVKKKSSMFQRFEIEHVPRSDNRQADALSKLTSSSPNGCLKNICWEVLSEQMIDAKELFWIDKPITS